MVYMLMRMSRDLINARLEILELRGELKTKQDNMTDTLYRISLAIHRIEHNVGVMQNTLDYPSERLVKRPRSYVRKAHLPQTDSQVSAVPSEKRSVGRPRKIPQSSEETSSQPEL